MCAAGQRATRCAALSDMPPWIPGATVEFVDLLPAELRAGPARELFYEVAVKNAKGRSAGWSERASALAGASAPAVSDLNALNSAAGVELRWKVTDPAEEGTLYRIRRELLPHSQAEDNAQAARHRGRTEGPGGGADAGGEGRGRGRNGCAGFTRRVGRALPLPGAGGAEGRSAKPRWRQDAGDAGHG